MPMPTHETDAGSAKPLPMAGLRVLDIATFVAAPFCGAILGEFGAEVIKIEKPGVGDPLRQWGTPTETGDTLVWLSEARNKKSVTLDLRKADGANLFRQLVAKSDVVLENYRPGTLEKWGLGYEELRKINPKLVMLRISAYGQTGPYRQRPGFARIAHAFSGLAYLAREPDGVPVIPGSTSLADYTSGLYGALGVLMALRVMERTGQGQYVDIGLYEPIFRMMDELAPAYASSGFVREPMGADTVNIVPHSHYRTSDDRWVAIACSSDRMFERLAEAMQRPDLGADPRYRTMQDRNQHRSEVNGIVAEWVVSLTAAEVEARCQEAQMPCGLLYSVADIFADPQYAARGNVVSIEDPRVGTFAAPNVVPVLSETPGRINSLGPALGEHNTEILEGLLGLSREQLAAFKKDDVV